MPEFLRATAKVESSFAIRGVRVRPGEEFRVDSERTADTLVRLGLAERVDRKEETPALLQPKSQDNDLLVPSTVVISTLPAIPHKRKRGRPRKGDK